MLLDKFTTDAGVFARAAGILPSNLPVMEDPKFLADRENMFGRSWQKSDVERGRPEAMVHMRKAFDVLEALLADGREWIAATEEVSLADIEGREIVQHDMFKMLTISSCLAF